ncbi:putative Ig domain-containing protein [Flavobacterium sp. SUN046]|uniref:putative Ig domain-containing protein n=1 Tax=Flavobacterium sp. SUN046 TaxID=3002440 RepID=UPI002DB65A2B|nr:putative Ig domain-containing protein [Flavobacterium sp. SUN046]MEC4051112.1 putative Ig domain-containing protein [Flavobacterium sp. SUN046]
MKKILFLTSSISLLLFSCTTDREIVSNEIAIDPNSVLVHYWNFNSLTGTQTTISPDLTLIPSSANITYNGTGAGYMDAFTPGYDVNAQNNEVAGSGIRARNPSDTRNLILTVPTTGYKKIVVQFAAAISSSGATTQNYSYSIDGTNYTADGLSTSVFNPTTDPISSLVSLDFTSINTVDNNPNFKIKITFTGATASGATGNSRFDNITLKGIPLSITAPPTNLSYSSTNSFILNSPITDLNPSVSGNVTNYIISPSLPTGLTLNPTTGIISGTPTALCNLTTYTITATNSYGSTTATITITVNTTINTTVYLLHYWNFNAIPTGTLTSVNADSSLIASPQASLSYSGTGAGYMDQYVSTTTANAQNADVSGLGIRLRNPSDTRSLIISAPTSGYKNIVTKFATAKSSTSGASLQNYSYSLDGINFTNANLSTTSFNPNIDPTYDIVSLDFTAITGANNNPNFKVKIDFGGPEATGASGNDRIDNLTFQANQL